MAAKRPLMVVIAGPNGSGRQLLPISSGVMNGSRAPAASTPTKSRGTILATGTVLRAARRAHELREQCLAALENFAFETVFSTRDKVDLLRRAKQSGYFIRLFYIGTEDPAINLRRVAQRVREGGHDVPPDKTVSRYHRANANLAAGLKLADRGYLYDNSADYPDAIMGARLLVRTRDGAIAKVYAPDMPAWARRALDEL